MVGFTIIIPVFNAAATLAKALETVLQQSYKNFEVLILDNFSTDSSLQVAKGFADARIKIFSAKDKGVYDAMNKGIALAGGEWLYFFGSDDHLYDANVLQDVAAFIKNNNCTVVYGKINSERFGGEYGCEFNAEKILHQNIGHQAIFFHRTVFERTGNFNLRYKTQADWDHNLRWFFAKHIKHCFFNRLIAGYADGGLSAGGDPLFEQHRIVNYVAYAGNNLPLKRRLQLLKYAWYVARKQKQTTQLLYIAKTGFKILLQW